MAISYIGKIVSTDTIKNDGRMTVLDYKKPESKNVENGPSTTPPSGFRCNADESLIVYL